VEIEGRLSLGLILCFDELAGFVLVDGVACFNKQLIGNGPEFSACPNSKNTLNNSIHKDFRRNEENA